MMIVGVVVFGSRVDFRRFRAVIAERFLESGARVSLWDMDKQALHDAAMSPFAVSDIPLRATLVPGYDRKGGLAEAESAFSAAVGLTSVTMTLAPMPLARSATPLPQWP